MENKQYKRVPFDIELAKKIQSGKVEGRIMTDTRTPLHITYWTCGGQNVNFDYILMILTKFCDDYHKEFCREGLQICKEHLFIELTEDAQKHEFKPFDKVLVRDYDGDKWNADFYSHLDDDGRYMCVSYRWRRCIPYEGNEHLLGTTDDPKL